MELHLECCEPPMARTSHSIPNLFLAGAPKCGTSSLAYYLGQHPEIYAPSIKEPVFFGSDLVAKGRLPQENYQRLFRDWCNESYAMDASTHYFYSVNAAQEIHDASPDAKVILMVRNPLKAVQSMYFQNRFNGIEDCETLEAALAAENARSSLQGPVPYGFLNSLLYENIYRYSVNIPRFISVFGASRVAISVLDDLKADPVLELERLCDFLNIAPEFARLIDLDVKNPATSSRLQWVNRLANYPPSWLKWFTYPIPRDFRLRLRDAMRSANTRPLDKPQMNASTRAQLRKAFEDEIQWLSMHLNRDLGHWLDDA